MSGTRSIRLATILLVAGFLGCAGGRPNRHHEPTPEEWAHALDAPAGRTTLGPRGSGAGGVHRLAAPAGWTQPRLVNPVDASQIKASDLEQNLGYVVFTWSMSSPEARYELELARDRNFLELEKTVPALSGIAAVPAVATGEHYWRVWVLSASGARLDLSSNVQSFKLE